MIRPSAVAALDRQKPDQVTQEDDKHWIEREEQARIDAIISGEEQGHYYLLIGEKGTGKSSMILEAMAKVNADGASMFEAHADLEIFRVRLGKALDYEFHEDYIGSLFSLVNFSTSNVVDALVQSYESMLAPFGSTSCISNSINLLTDPSAVSKVLATPPRYSTSSAPSTNSREWP